MTVVLEVASCLSGPLRASASRSADARCSWPRVPAVAVPGGPKQSAQGDDGGGQGEIGLDAAPSPLGAAAQPAVVVEPGVGALDDSAFADLDRRRFSALGDLRAQTTVGQLGPAGPVVVSGVQVHRRLVRIGADLLEQPGQDVEGGRQQQMVAGVGGRGQRGERHPGAVGELGALESELGPVHRAAPGALTAAGGLRDAPVDGDVGQVQADQPLVGGQHRAAQPVEEPGGDPLIPPAAQRGGRARRVGEAFVAAAEDEGLDDLVEDDVVGDAPAVTAQRMPVDAGRDQGEELLAQRVKDARWDGRHERSTAHGALAPSRGWPSCLPSSISHAGRRQRPTGGRPNSRNGYRTREFDTRAGTLEVAIPKLRAGSYFPDWLLERRRRAERALTTVVATCYLLGVSTRRMEKLVESLGITRLSKSQVSEMARDLDAQVADFRHRPLDAGPYTFLAADALVLKVREGGRVVNVHALVATGVNADGHREILGLQVTSAEDGAGWLAFFRDLTARGLTGVQLVTSDAHAGLVSAIGATLPGAGWQRCRTHWGCKESTCRRVDARCWSGEGIQQRSRAGEPGGQLPADILVDAHSRLSTAH